MVSQRAWSCSSAPLASIQIWGSGGSNKPESPGVRGETFLEVQDHGEKEGKGGKVSLLLSPPLSCWLLSTLHHPGLGVTPQGGRTPCSAHMLTLVLPWKLFQPFSCRLCHQVSWISPPLALCPRWSGDGSPCWQDKGWGGHRFFGEQPKQ